MCGRSNSCCRAIPAAPSISAPASGFSVREILAAIAAETGREVPHVVKPRRAGDPTYLVADVSAARKALNFTPVHSDLATVIRTAWAWHQKAHPLKAG